MLTPHRRSVRAIAGVLCVAGLVGLILVVSGVASSASSKPIVLGVSNMNTGAGAIFGAQYEAGVQAALKQINSSGGINGRQVKLVEQDNKTDPVQAVQVAQKLVQANHVDALLCDCFTTIMFPVAKALENGNIVIISSASSAPTLAQQGDDFVSTIATDDSLGPIAASWVLGLGFKQVGVVAANDQIGLLEASVFANAYKKNGGSVITSLKTNDNLPDYTAEMQQVVNSGAKVIFSTVCCADGILQWHELNQLGWKGLLFSFYPTGNGLNTDSNSNGRVFGVEPGYSAGKTSASAKAVIATIHKYTGKPVTYYNGVGYDAVQIGARAVANAKNPKSRASVKQAAVVAANSYPQATGSFKFNSHFIRILPPTVFYVVHNGQFVQVDKAGKIIK